MEPLAYVELAVTYEESGGVLELPVSPALHPLPLKKMGSWAAIAMLILLGGFGTALSTAFSDATPVPRLERSVAPR